MSQARLIVALDLENFEEARQLIDEVGDAVEIFKVGSQMFTAYGPFITRYLQSKGKKVFLDLKFHDIPNTVASAVKSAVSLSASPNNDPGFAPLFMLTVHTAGGKEMLEAAVQAGKSQAQALGVARPLIVGVTVLTSVAPETHLESLVLERARLAKQAGLDGVVASVEEAARIRQELGPDFLIVTPGIRPAEASLNDQKRVATPQVAILQGSNFLVVGRPIIQAASPRAAAQKILEDRKRK
jgi:orotidine-5'-phosphate decarboxylase